MLAVEPETHPVSVTQPTKTTRCAFCGTPVPAGEGFRVLPMQVYCTEEHAVEDQQENPL